MTRPLWDSQFRFSELLPDFDTCLDNLAARSAAFARGRVFQNLSYGADARQWAELTPGRGSPSVLPVVIHGGYWRALEAQNHRALMDGLQAHGAEVGNVEYRLMPQVRLGDVVGDVVAALTALADAVPEAQMLLIGHSAGAHLALSALNTPRIAARTRGVIAISGVYELWPLAHCFVQDEVHLTAAEISAHTLDPLTPRPPIVYLTGAQETYEFHRQSARMAQGPRTAWRQIPDAHHMNIPLAATTPGALASALSTLHELEAAP